MKDEEAQLAGNTTITASTPSSAATKAAISSSDGGGLFGRGKYKLWALAAIILLAFWSMFTGSVTLKWSADNLNHVSDEFDSSVHDDLDILEVEQKEKVVRHMWDMYTHNSAIRLPSFWQAAFKAAYEDLTSEVPALRDAAISDIAKMSLRSSLSHAVEFEQSPMESSNRASERRDTHSSRVRKMKRR